MARPPGMKVPDHVPELLAEAVERARISGDDTPTGTSPEAVYQRRAEEVARDCWRQLFRYPDPMRNHHIAGLYDCSEDNVRRWRKEWRKTGKLSGPRWDAPTKQLRLYRKSDVVAAMVLDRIGEPPAPSHFAKRVG